MTQRSYPLPPETEPVDGWRQLRNAFANIFAGRLNNTGTVTLTANAASTVVSDYRAHATSFIGFMPTTANAAADYGAGTFYVSSRGSNTFTIAHANNANNDKTFVYAVLG